MKKTLSIFAFALAAVLPQAHAANLSLNVIPPLTVGSPFDVQVLATNVFSGKPAGDAVVAYGFSVVVGDSSIFNFTGEGAGPLFTDVSFGGLVEGFATNPAGVDAGAFTEPLILAVLHFQALKGGSTSISIATDLSDPNQGLYFADEVSPDSMSARVLPTATAVPELGTLALGGLALVGLCLKLSRRVVS